MLYSSKNVCRDIGSISQGTWTPLSKSGFSQQIEHALLCLIHSLVPFSILCSSRHSVLHPLVTDITERKWFVRSQKSWRHYWTFACYVLPCLIRIVSYLRDGYFSKLVLVFKCLSIFINSKSADKKFCFNVIFSMSYTILKRIYHSLL